MTRWWKHSFFLQAYFTAYPKKLLGNSLFHNARINFFSNVAHCKYTVLQHSQFAYCFSAVTERMLVRHKTKPRKISPSSCSNAVTSQVAFLKSTVFNNKHACLFASLSYELGSAIGTSLEDGESDILMIWDILISYWWVAIHSYIITF